MPAVSACLSFDVQLLQREAYMNKALCGCQAILIEKHLVRRAQPYLLECSTDKPWLSMPRDAARLTSSSRVKTYISSCQLIASTGIPASACPKLLPGTKADGSRTLCRTAM